MFRRQEESVELDSLAVPVDVSRFQGSIRRLRTKFNIYATTCPVPLPAPGLLITSEIRNQCECYLPIAEIAAIFNKLYSTALAYQPILSSTPFHNAISWADAFALLPNKFQFSADPSKLLESLLADRKLLNIFLFASFLPDRFYGKVGRYPSQFDFIRGWLESRSEGKLKCLDVACGSGEETYRLATLISQAGFSAEAVRIEGWTVEPLEVWSATYCCFPHNLQRELALRQIVCNLSSNRYESCISFSCRDILQSSVIAQFDLVLCNGLLGGPIIHSPAKLDLAVSNLSQLLLPGGMLLAADSFHGGWKQQCPQTGLQALFEKYGLKSFVAGEGICGLKPYQ